MPVKMSADDAVLAANMLKAKPIPSVFHMWKNKARNGNVTIAIPIIWLVFMVLACITVTRFAVQRLYR